MKKAIVLLSGGLDSATALWLAKRKWQVYALTFKYADWNRKEVIAAKKLAKMAKVVKHIIVDVNFLNSIYDLMYLKLKGGNLRNFPPTYVPSRNTVFFGIAAHYAEIYGINYIVTGHSFLDPFPDSKPRYIKALNDALNYGSWLGEKNKIKIVTPFYRMDKIGILRVALKLKVPLKFTWSCYFNDKVPCGKCKGCVSRVSAFKKLKPRAE